jgi:hypothetical protein
LPLCFLWIKLATHCDLLRYSSCPRQILIYFESRTNLMNWL